MHKMITLIKVALPLILLVVLTVYPGLPAFSANEPKISINELVVQTDVPPKIVNGRILVPIRVISENLGAEVMWQGSVRTVHIKHEGKEIILQENNTSALVGYQAVTLDTPAIMVNSRVMVPLRFIAEALGAEVKWLAEARFVIIQTKTGVPVPAPQKPKPDEQPKPGEPGHEASRVLKSIEYGEYNQGFEAKLNIDKGGYKACTLIEPNRLVIDFEGSIMGRVEERTDIPASGLVQQIRVGVPEQGTVRVVFDLAAPADYLVTEGQNQLILRLVQKGSVPATASLTGRTIMIDPGHGGWHPGAVGVSGSKEKDLVLMVSLKLKGALEARGARVLLTRTDDTYYELSARSAQANKLKPDVFVSIHGNAHPDANVVGVETFYFHAASLELAREIQKAIIKHTGQVDLEIKWRGLSVIRNTNCPGVLVELGFMSNAAEERYLWLGSTQDLHVKAMVEGLENYFAGR